MSWYVNFIMGFIIGSFLAVYSPAYFSMFKKLFSWLAKKASSGAAKVAETKEIKK